MKADNNLLNLTALLRPDRPASDPHVWSVPELSLSMILMNPFARRYDSHIKGT